MQPRALCVHGGPGPAGLPQPPLPAAACRLPIVQGPCQKPVLRWAFDAAQGKCIKFSYGGCKGNGNQFYSEKECKEYCGAPPLAGMAQQCVGGWGSKRAGAACTSCLLQTAPGSTGSACSWGGSVLGPVL